MPVKTQASVEQLKKALSIAEQIQVLENQLSAILEQSPAAAATVGRRRGRPPGSGRGPGRPPGRPPGTPATPGTPPSGNGRRKKRRMSPAARAAISAAQR